jgi:hypothetical protein
MRVEECRRWFAETSLCIRGLDARRGKGVLQRSVYLMLHGVREVDQSYVATTRHGTDPMAATTRVHKMR